MPREPLICLTFCVLRLSLHPGIIVPWLRLAHPDSPPTTPTTAVPTTAVAAGEAAPVSHLSLLVFFSPLAFSGLMMTLDLPVVNAMLNRLPNPNTSVAALRVAFSLALVCLWASHIAMIDVSTALSADQRTFYMLRRFYIVMAGVLLVASVVVFSPSTT